jgi:hypothetical protein
MKTRFWMVALAGTAVGLLGGYTFRAASARATPPAVQHFVFASLPTRA